MTPCYKTKITLRPLRRGDTYPIGNTEMVNGEQMKKEYTRCTENVLCAECLKKKK